MHVVLRGEQELAQWLASHIKGVDPKLEPCVKCAARSAPPEVRRLPCRAAA